MSSDVSIIITVSIIIGISPFLAKIIKIPITPIEIILGSIAGYVGFLSSEHHIFLLVAEFGFLYLMFLAGTEINLRQILKVPNHIMKNAVLYTILLYLTSALFVYYFHLSNLFIVTMPLISIGLIATLTKEYGKNQEWLNLAITVGVVGEIISITVVTFVAGALEFGVGTKFYLTILYLMLFLGIFWITFKILRVVFWWYPEIKTFLMPYSDHKDQDIRLSMSLFFITIAIMLYLHLELAFGAFLAGVFISTFFEHKVHLPEKLGSFGFGLLIPIFFIYTGASFQLDAILMEGLLERTFLIIFIMIAMRVLSSMVFVKKLGFKNTILFALSHSMPLTLLIAVASIAYHSNSIDQFNYFALILASIFEVIICMVGINIVTSKITINNYNQK